VDLDPVLLSRIQFGFLISFHIVFPAFTIGLAAWLATIEAARLATGNMLYRRVFDFWLPIFATSFGMGVVTGVVMAFQFGTNWGVLAVKTGSIQGPLLGYEGLTAFMLEATFFGVMLLGRDRVSPRFYFFSCCMVSLGTLFSSFWILANNSWMQVPLGHTVVDGKIIPTDWKQIVLGPIQMVRWPHMLLAALLTTAMCVSATGAWYHLRRVHLDEGRVMLHWGLGLAAVLIPIQLFFGHLTGEYVLKHQPAKFAAIEARWKNEQPASEVLIAIPDEANERNLLRHLGAQARQLHRIGQFHRGRARARILSARRPAAGADSLFRLPDHGGHGTGHAGGFVVRQLPALARQAGVVALVPVVHLRCLPDRLRGHSHRLVHRRDRTPALGGLWVAADPRRCHALADHR
jgi:cytochrome bd-type quinol oxidase subunit 1